MFYFCCISQVLIRHVLIQPYLLKIYTYASPNLRIKVSQIYINNFYAIAQYFINFLDEIHSYIFICLSLESCIQFDIFCDAHLLTLKKTKLQGLLNMYRIFLLYFIVYKVCYFQKKMFYNFTVFVAGLLHTQNNLNIFLILRLQFLTLNLFYQNRNW